MALNVFTGATDANWGTGTNWSQGTVPTATDTHTVSFDATSPNCTVNTSNRVCNAIDFTGYTNTLTMTFNIAVSGAITFQANQSSRIAGSGLMSSNETATITSNGGTFPNAFSFLGTSKTVTLADNMTIGGLVTLNFGTAGVINSNKIISTTSVLGSNVTTTGTMVLEMTGTGTLTTTGTGSFGFAGITIKSTASVTLGTAVNIRGGSSLVYTVEAGAVVVTSGNTLTIATTGVTMNTSVMGTTTNAWNNISMTSSGSTVTLTSHLYGTGTLSTASATTSVWTGAFNIKWMGTVTIGTSWSGTTTLELVGNTTIGGGIIANPMTWSSGTITQTAFTYRTSTWTIASGVVVSSSGIITLNTGSPTITCNASGVTLNAITIGTGIITPVFNGTNGFTIGTLLITTSGGSVSNLTLKNGNSYTISTDINCSVSGVTQLLPFTIKSDSGGNQATLILPQGATQNLGFVDATDINSSAGQTIWSFRGVLSNATNWSNLTASAMQHSSTFSN